MTRSQALRYERRRRERLREQRARRAAIETMLLLLVALALLLALCMTDGTSDADLMQAEYDQWAAMGVTLWEW